MYRRFVPFHLMLLFFVAGLPVQAQENPAPVVTAKPQTPPAAGPDDKKTIEATPAKIETIQTITSSQTATSDSTQSSDPTLVSAPGSFARRINWTVMLDAYYAYNFNRPDDNANAGLLLEARHNRPTLNMLKLNLEKQATLESPFGFRFDAVGGPSNQFLLGTKDRARGLETTRLLWQAYVSYTAPIGNGLTFDFGKFTTPIGMESVDTKDNFNYSHSYLFNYGPFYHTGLRTKYSFNERVSVTGYLVNAWDSVGDSNSGKTFGATVSFLPHKKLSLSQTYLTGPENPHDNGNWRNVFNTLVTFMATEKWTFLGDFVYGNDRVTFAPQRNHWTGLAGFARYAFNDRFALSGRFDMFRDEAGLFSGQKQTLHGYTVTQEVRMMDNLISKFEFRRGVSNQEFFTASRNRLSKDQNVALMGMTWFFTNKK